jgi:hypothetical protein
MTRIWVQIATSCASRGALLPDPVAELLIRREGIGAGPAMNGKN